MSDWKPCVPDCAWPAECERYGCPDRGRAAAEVVRLPGTAGMGRCLDCGAPCPAGYTHFAPAEGMCVDCSAKLLDPEHHEALERRREMRVVAKEAQ